MMDIKRVNIWKPEDNSKKNEDVFLNTDVSELCLGVRSFNCLKRANCNTIRDVLSYIGEDGQGLRRIRNLGACSEREILEKIEELRKICAARETNAPEKKVTIIKPAKKVWDRKIDEFHLSNYSLTRLKRCGIYKVGDLYRQTVKEEPGWYAVRELFEKVPSCR